MKNLQNIAITIDSILRFAAATVIILTALGKIPVSRDKEKQEKFINKWGRFLFWLGILLIIEKIVHMIWFN